MNSKYITNKAKQLLITAAWILLASTILLLWIIFWPFRALTDRR